MRAAIIEDFPQDQAIIGDYIKKYAQENHLLIDVTFFSNGEDFLSSSGISEYNLVFLDIYFDSGLTGIETARKIRQFSENCLIIFVTVTTQFAVESYEVNALYYLLKPLSYDAFSAVMERAEKNIKKDQLFIEVKSRGENRKIPVSHICYVDYYAHYVQIHTTHTMIRTYMRFAEIEAMLLKYPDFLRCFRNILVNMNCIKKIDDNFFVVQNDERIPINRKSAKEIKEAYRNYMFQKLGNGEN